MTMNAKSTHILGGKMKIHKRIILFTFVCILTIVQMGATFVRAGENSGDDLSGQIEVILNVDDELMKKYIKDFNKKYSDVKVKYTRYSDYETEIMKRIESGDYGDVLFIPASIDSQGVETYLEPLGKVEDFTDKYNFVENAYVLNDKVYSLPSSAYLKGILYNREVFDKAGITSLPKSHEEFINALQMIKDRTDAVPFYTNYEMEWVLNDWSFFPYIEMSGDTEYRGEKFVYEKNPFTKGSNYYEVYKLLYDIVNQGLCEKESLVSDWGQICTKLNNGEIASVVVGTWSYRQMKYAGDNNDSVAFMPFPNEIDGKQYATIGIDYGYCISKNSKNKDIARKFIDYMIDESGYAVDNDRISIVKTDPLPDVYSNVSNLEVEISKSLTEQSYYYYNILAKDRNPESAQSLREVIDEARKKDGDYDALMKSWNDSWEAARPVNMKTYSYEYLQSKNNFGQNMSLDNPQSFVMNNFDVEYSKTEKEYIREKKQVKVGYLTNMAPFQYQEKDAYGSDSFVGLSKVICDSVKDSTNLKFVYVAFDNCEKMIEALNAGEIDIAAGITGEEKNVEELTLSKSYLELSNAIIKADTLELNELSDKKEGYVKGSEINTRISTDSKRVGFDSMEELVNAVEKKKADFAICNYYSANYYIKDGDYSYVALVPLTEKTEYYMAFSKDVDTRLVSICNKCIYSFPEESIQMMLMQYMDPQAKNITLRRFIIANPIKSALFIGVLLLFVFGVIFLIKHEKDKNRKKHEMDIKRYEILSQLTDEYVFDYDFATDIIHFDEKFVGKFGFTQDVNMSENLADNTALIEFVKEFINAKTMDTINGEPFQLIDSANEQQWYRMISYRVMDEKQKPQHIIGKLINVQDLVEERKEIEKKADQDFLTSLYNRTGFEKRVGQMYEKYADADHFVFAVLDLDNFKSVNDSLGHLGGDKALMKLAIELSKISSDKIVCARYGGDEFVISMFDVSKEDADMIFDKLVSDMNHTMHFEGKSHVLSISLGAVYSDKIKTTQQMFECADKVLYSVKQSGKNQYRMLEYEGVG